MDSKRAGLGAGGRRQGLAGLRDDAPSERSATKRRRCGGRRGACGAWPRCRWAAAGPGLDPRRRTEPHVSDHAPLVWRAPVGGGRDRADYPTALSTARLEAAAGPAGPGRGAGGRRQGLAGLRDRSLRAAGSRVAISRAGRRPPAHTAAKPNKTGPAAAGPDGARKTRGATSPARKSELLVVLRVLVGLAAVGAAECADRRHLLRR